MHSAIVYEIILVGFKIGEFPQNHQFANLKLKTSPCFLLYGIVYIAIS